MCGLWPWARVQPNQAIHRLLQREQRVCESGPLPRWTSENRPYVDTSKPANGAEPEQDYLYLARGHSGKHFCETYPDRFILTSPGRRVRQRRDATGAPTQRPEWLGAASAAPQARQPFWRQCDKSQGFGDSVPK